ncbi:MAG: NYN domain-containing protein [Nitrospirota bacterium]
MLRILIDGYNMIGQADREMETLRERLVKRLNEYSLSRKHEITVVFDGWKSGLPVENSEKSGAVMVIYSRLGEKADDVIKRMVSGKKGGWIVVSSDREIERFSMSCGCTVISSAEFEERIDRVIKQGKSYTEPSYISTEILYLKDDDSEDSLIVHHKRKGNPRRPSKKEREKRRVMEKL